MKYLILLLTLLGGGCVAGRTRVPADGDLTLDQIRRKLNQHDYFIDHDRCFSFYAVCLGEKKKTNKECWAIHEQCVINVYNQYKSIDK